MVNICHTINSHRQKPLIGVTLDYQKPGGYSGFPWYALRTDYFRAIEWAGGIPIAIPFCYEAIAHYISMIDGLVMPGGDHDINPADYGDGHKHHQTATNDHRVNFDRTIMQAIIDIKKPLLAICAGQQLLNVMLGGNLIQHIPDEVENAIIHTASVLPPLPLHPVKVIRNTLLHDIVGCDDIIVNSHHHQAVKNLGQDLVINAVAPDDVIEGIELRDHPFGLGLEWHPEFIETTTDQAIIKRFIYAAQLS